MTAKKVSELQVGDSILISSSPNNDAVCFFIGKANDPFLDKRTFAATITAISSSFIGFQLNLQPNDKGVVEENGFHFPQGNFTLYNLSADTTVLISGNVHRDNTFQLRLAAMAAGATPTQDGRAPSGRG